METLIARGLDYLIINGFFDMIEEPLSGATLHDVGDHLLFPSQWKGRYPHLVERGYILPSVEGEVLAAVNMIAKKAIADPEEVSIALLPQPCGSLTEDQIHLCFSEAILYWCETPEREAVAKYYCDSGS